MLRLHQREQILILRAADRYPGPLAQWLRAWVDAQRDAPSGAGIEIEDIPISELEEVDVNAIRKNRLSTPAYQREAQDGEKIDKAVQTAKLLESIGYKEMELPQRRAIRKTLGAEVKTIEQTDRLPDDPKCWIGTHDMDDWEELDCFLWVVTGTFSSGTSLKKWGCGECARAVAKTHPEAILNAID